MHGEEMFPLRVHLFAGGTISVEFVDSVYPDRTVPQHEGGWWVVSGDTEYFLSESGTLWGEDPDNNSWKALYQHALGIEPKLARNMREFERSLAAYEATEEDLHNQFLRGVG